MGIVDVLKCIERLLYWANPMDFWCITFNINPWWRFKEVGLLIQGIYLSTHIFFFLALFSERDPLPLWKPLHVPSHLISAAVCSPTLASLLLHNARSSSSFLPELGENKNSCTVDSNYLCRSMKPAFPLWLAFFLSFFFSLRSLSYLLPSHCHPAARGVWHVSDWPLSPANGCDSESETSLAN